MRYSSEVIGKNIKKLRSERKWAQDRLGQELGISGKQISKYESGETTPPIDMLFLICDKFNCELGFLLGEEDYSFGTKLDTAIESELGLTSEAIASLKNVTGKKKNCLSFGYESKQYRKILSTLFASQDFPYFVESLFDLEHSINERIRKIDKIIQKYKTEIFDQGMQYYYSTTDYEHSDEQLPDIFYEVFKDIRLIEDIEHDQDYCIKVCRYEVRESLERLLESIYPKKSTS